MKQPLIGLAFVLGVLAAACSGGDRRALSDFPTEIRPLLDAMLAEASTAVEDDVRTIDSVLAVGLQTGGRRAL